MVSRKRRVQGYLAAVGIGVITGVAYLLFIGPEVHAPSLILGAVTALLINELA